MGWKFWRSEKSDAEVSLERLQAGMADPTPVPPASTGDAASAPGTSPAGSPSGFEMPIEDVFTITGRGTVVTGTVALGTVRVGQQVAVRRLTGGSPLPTTVTGIEAFRKLLDEAGVGDNVGLLLRGVDRADVNRGDVVTG
ncbi:hypothetical protein D9V37_19205 [Nocardioides mangrovicus]|uniref:Elongation factor Tu n=1 Tax=Nocardioides mangrovicus TaxID=2478913 RepID=A0A3L8NYA3_9ACTN|nr:hypothetical protein D9V37_19205 [Nocardioides mangrovicus]